MARDETALVRRQEQHGPGNLLRLAKSRERDHLRFLSLAETCRARDTELEPGRALRAYLEDLVTNTNIYRGLAASLGTVLNTGTPGCHATTKEGQRLLRRAQEAGAIRRDVSFDDLVFVATAICLAAEQGKSSKSRVGHLLDLFLDGINVR